MVLGKRQAEQMISIDFNPDSIQMHQPEDDAIPMNQAVSSGPKQVFKKPEAMQPKVGTLGDNLL